MSTAGHDGYRELLPTAALRPFVECYWVRRSPVPAIPTVAQVLPDGCLDLLFDARTGDALVVGTMTSAHTFVTTEACDLFAVRFRPGGQHRFLNPPAHELTDHHVALTEVAPDWRTTAERACAAASTAARLALLEHQLLRRLPATRDAIDHAIAALAATPGAGRVDALAADLGISRQWFTRTVQARCGVPPRLLARIARFRHASQALADGLPAAMVAARHGYADQAHLCRDVREFAGTTPSALRRQPATGEFPNVQD